MKYAFILFDDPKERNGFVRAEHALHYAIKLKQKGHDAVIYLEGPATALPIIAEQNQTLKELYNNAIKNGLIIGACGYCSVHVNVKDEVKAKGLRLIGDENNHEDPSFLIDQGYQIIII